jgi:hypothetical protein
MPSIVTRFYRNDNAEHFIQNFGEEGGYYFFLANLNDWTGDPPTPTQKIEDIDFRIWDKIVAMKRIAVSDLSLVIPRYDWTSGTVYKKYKSYEDIFTGLSAANTFYVVTSDFRVYKCIDNNQGAQSTVEPTQTDLINTFKTSDGYEWKYMYPIIGSDIQKFISSEYVPIKFAETLNNFNTEQFNIQLSAIKGTVDTIDVTANGSNYINFSGQISGYTNTTVLTIDVTGANRVDDDFYNGCNLFVERGTGLGQLVEISDYEAATAKITLATALSRDLAIQSADEPSFIRIGPKVTIKTDGTTQPTAYANINPLTSNGVNYITVVNKGVGSNRGTITITDSTFSGATGSGATAEMNFSPTKGHGSNAVRELHNGALMFSVRLSKNEEEDLLETANYGTYGLLQYPEYANGTVVTNTAINNTTRLNLSGVSASLTNATALTSWKVEGLTSSATANAVTFVSNFDGANGTLSITNGEYTAGEFFTTGETIRLNGDINYQGVLDSITYSTVQPYTGEVLYIENREQITRNPLQIEDFKIIVQY